MSTFGSDNSLGTFASGIRSLSRIEKQSAVANTSSVLRISLPSGVFVSFLGWKNPVPIWPRLAKYILSWIRYTRFRHPRIAVRQNRH
jgi:hypothetical protein